jgi:hypothetical protein
MTRATTELAHLFRALKVPAAARALPKLADRARAEEWSFEQFTAALLKTETDSRDQPRRPVPDQDGPLPRQKDARGEALRLRAGAARIVCVAGVLLHRSMPMVPMRLRTFFVSRTSRGAARRSVA